MKNQKVGTLLGMIILIIIAITAGVFVWKVEKGQEEQTQGAGVQQKTISEKQGQEIVSEAKDKYGCRNAAGLFWCEEKQSCVQNWSKSCGNVDIADISKWDEFDSKKHDPRSSISFKYPSAWFNPTDIAGESSVVLPFYSKDEYTRICQLADGGAMHCNDSGHTLSLNIFSSTYIPRKVSYTDEKKSYITINGHKGIISEGIVSDTNNGLIANNGEKEIRALFSNVEGSSFEIIMKITNDSDKDVFNKIISTVEFSTVDELKSFSYEKGIGYYGTLELTGYLDTKLFTCNPGEGCLKTVTYAYFVITKTDNELIYNFTNRNEGNSFVGENNIGLGCFEKDANRIYSVNFSDSGQVENIITGGEFKKLLQSNKNNPVKIKLTKPYFSGGGGAPECYSHFRSFKVNP